MIRVWLSIALLSLMVSCAAPPPVETAVRYGRMVQIDAVMIDGDRHLGLDAIIGAVAGGVIGHQFGGGTGQYQRMRMGTMVMEQGSGPFAKEEPWLARSRE